MEFVGHRAVPVEGRTAEISWKTVMHSPRIVRREQRTVTLLPLSAAALAIDVENGLRDAGVRDEG